MLYFIPVHKFLFNFFITFLRDSEFALNMEPWEENIRALFKRLCSNNFLPACFYTLIHLTYFEYFIKIFEILSISPQFLLFDMVRCLPDQNKSLNYIKKNLNYYLQYRSKWKCEKCNITPIPVSFFYYSLRFPFFILKIDQNLSILTSVFLFSFYFFFRILKWKAVSVLCW